MNNNFKQTDIGLIPEDWDIKKIGELDLDINDGNYGADYPRQEDFIPEGIPFIRANNIKDLKIIDEDLRFISQEKHNYLTKGHLKLNDILLTNRGQIGKLAIVPSKYVNSNINAQIVRINTNKKINSFYLLYYFDCSLAQKQFVGLTSGTALTQLPQGKLRMVNVVLPPLPEQKKIAHVLSKIQQAIETQEQIIKTTQELKKALMQKLFTEGLPASGGTSCEPQKQTEIGPIPESWEVKTLEKLTLETKTRNPSREHPNNFIKYVDVSAISNDFFRIINHQLVKGSEAPGRARKVIQTRDIIFATIRPTLKRIAKINSDYDNEYCSTAFCVLRSNRELLNEDYLFYYLQTDFFIDEIGKHQSGASYPAVRDDDVKNIMIPLPKLIEQERIAELFLQLDKKLNQAFEIKTFTSDLFLSTLEKLMTGQIRVKDINLGKHLS